MSARVPYLARDMFVVKCNSILEAMGTYCAPLDYRSLKNLKIGEYKCLRTFLDTAFLSPFLG